MHRLPKVVVLYPSNIDPGLKCTEMSYEFSNLSQAEDLKTNVESRFDEVKKLLA